ncbi:MAG: carboxymuconolactone decarboxylase family protein [Geminicoccaceae bacterium]
MTAWAWGFGWGDETIDAKTRSMMNLAMIGALGKMREWEIHCTGALNNGVSKAESGRSSMSSASIAACRRRSSAFA